MKYLTVGLIYGWLTLVGQVAFAGDPVAHHYRGESAEPSGSAVTRTDVRTSSLTPGSLVSPRMPNGIPNRGSWSFDGARSIVHGPPSNAAGFAENFTWEGFFLTPSSNRYLAETGIADRLVTQFAFDKGEWTRLAIGLVADRLGKPRLSVELEGFDGRSFAAGDQVVSADRWHHFALVHEGTPAAARLRWYLDYKLTGELFLGGQANQNTLRPPGSARFTFGARLRSGGTVNRGFEGLLDELRLVPRSLSPQQFLRCDNANFTRPVDSKPLADREDSFWRERHAWARREAAGWAGSSPRPSSIDGFFPTTAATIDDGAFFRRLSLAVRGRIPTLDELERFLKDDSPDNRDRAIDQFLASPDWADGWVGYWQDVLAENPSVVFPTLNNSGAFRHWIHESFRENVPFDRFVTELLMLERVVGDHGGDEGPAAFALATGNDAPMAMRASVALRAFAAVDLTCARCHDSPIDDFKQEDLFRAAAFLNGEPLKVPASSVAAVGKASQPGAITSSLAAGQLIAPTAPTSHWLPMPEQADQLRPIDNGSRTALAALITSPRNPRFSSVVVNRVWQHFFGKGLLEPVDRWPREDDSRDAQLLRWLSQTFVEDGYDAKQLARRVLRSRVWQARRETRRRLSAEQLVDSLFVAVGKDFQAETLGVHATDPGAVQLPRPRRAWQFAALPNVRDRPALGMPVNQTIVDVMAAFGWNGNRQQPRSHREETMSALQPLLLFNGLMSQRVVRLSEQSEITKLCLEDSTSAELVDRLFLTVLSRYPDPSERVAFRAVLEPGYERRRTGEPPRPSKPLNGFQPDWRKHLEPEQTRLMMAAQRRVALGEQPTARLAADFRERVEDVLWALINSPEFVIIP